MEATLNNVGPAQALEEAVKNAGPPRRGGLQPAPKRIIPLLVPTIGMTSFWWVTAVYDLLWPLNCGKQVIPVRDVRGGEIGEMRNKLVAMCLATEKHHNVDMCKLFWLDDDVIVNRATILALASHDRDIAAGVYMNKGLYGDPLIFDGPGSGAAKFEPGTTREAWGWAQGLSLVSIEVYKRMRDELDLGVDKYGNPQWYKTPEFGVNDEGGIITGGTEDFHFFQNANRLGYTCLVDQTAHAFGFHYDASTDTGYPETQWKQYMRREPLVWQTKNGEVVWP